MPDFEDAYDAILGQFATQWATLRPSDDVPISWPNRHFDPRTDFDPNDHTAWVAINVLGGEAFQASLGGDNARRFRRVGIVAVQVFAPLGAGANSALAVADDVATALQGVTVAGVILRGAAINPVGRDPQGEWYQVNIEVPYRFDMVGGS